MALSAFDDKSHAPQDAELSAVLGKTFALWSQLRESVGSKSIPVTPEWGYTSKSTGWGLRVKLRDRIILYMTPCKGYFLVSFALGEKAVKAVLESDLPAPARSLIENAKKYAEGRGVRLEVRSAKDLRVVQKLADAKMEH